MFLSSVDILGFKSFPNRTRIEFASGLTGVVGPNGCGKTNVLDAIRWVLGEQRTSVLRGGKMEDVIFSGTREIKPLGMAEVSLTVINDDNRLPTEYSSVTITRRLYRSGESEYLLNKTVCRLKDITELFADTGMGANAYSAIELAMVEAILSDKTDQRRALFDEAAGITKYKIRKRAALRKLEATEQDLLRLNDILSEVTSQTNSLHRQMNKAERYKNLTDRIEHLELVLLKDDFRRLSENLAVVREDKRATDIKLAQAQAEIDKWELMREDAESKITELGSELHKLRVSLEEAAEEYHRLNNELAVTLERIKSSQAADQNDEQELAGIARKKQQLQAELVQSRENREKLQQRLADLEVEEQQRNSELAAQLELLQEARRESQHAQRDLFAIEGQQNAFAENERQLQERIDRDRSELQQLQEKKQAAESELSETESELSSLTEQKETLQTRQRELTEQQSLIHAESIKARAQLETRMAQVAEAILNTKSTEARVNMTEDMIASYEGYGSGVTALLGEENRLDGVIDTVANLIAVEPQYRLAIESALGQTAQYVVVRDRSVAERAIDYLRDNDLGSVTFLLLDAIQSPGNFTFDTTLKIDGVLARARDIVTVKDEYAKLADLLLGDLLIVADRRTARIVQSEQEVPTVTVTGELSATMHSLEGGSNREARLVGRDAQLADLNEKLAWSRVELARLRYEKEQEERQAQQIDSQHQAITTELSEIGKELGQAELSRSKAELQHKHAEQRCSELDTEIAKLQTELEEVSQRLDKLRADHQRLTGDSDGRRSDLQSREESVEKLEAEAERLSRTQEEVRSQHIRARTELTSLEGNIRRSEELLDDLEHEAERRKQDRLDRETEAAELEQRVVEIRALLDKVSESQEQLRQEERQLEERQQDLNVTQSEQNELLKAARKEREIERGKNEELLVRETETKSRYEEAHRVLRLNHSIEPERMELPQPLAEETAAEMREELDGSRDKLSQMGMVNMLALEEYERESQRQEFLEKQINDLTEAKDNLKATITRINSTARKLFTDTFNQVRQNFREVFVELFQGGDADIRLVDEDDPLESAILISARPRGKRLLTISQLSGGEKALTAISLLFAIYLVKPSPFCILDEVDAPLDDANVGRFLKLVRTFSERTQFVVITHNKRTMEQCSRLYGVTMQQPGASQLVSVDFEKLGREFVPETMTYTQTEPESTVEEQTPPPPPEPEVAEVSAEPKEDEQ